MTRPTHHLWPCTTSDKRPPVACRQLRTPVPALSTPACYCHSLTCQLRHTVRRVIVRPDGQPTHWAASGRHRLCCACSVSGCYWDHPPRNRPSPGRPGSATNARALFHFGQVPAFHQGEAPPWAHGPGWLAWRPPKTQTPPTTTTHHHPPPLRFHLGPDLPYAADPEPPHPRSLPSLAPWPPRHAT